MSALRHTPRVLAIAGSDSGGGAGIQADLKAIAARGAYGATAVTALTAQNTLGVQGVFSVTPEFVAQQIDSVMQDIGADVWKIGMLGSVAIIECVAERALHYDVQRLVLDPVMVAKGGDKLLRDDAIAALRQALL
ncbi:MAG: bifunctional hydroxymethylpyrimidine kinase/phosphomethylpyrimidine kinase, partial [Gammaproteobacteria bacterium]|nr:bifunctional hydroxymethylpyrimidine kinase/phosphomethylpyrimidine kinase [Gammaproteobacteria bacterium]